MTNAQILTAVILKWGEPVIPVMIGNTLNGISAGMLRWRSYSSQSDSQAPDGRFPMKSIRWHL